MHRKSSVSFFLVLGSDTESSKALAHAYPWMTKSRDRQIEKANFEKIWNSKEDT